MRRIFFGCACMLVLFCAEKVNFTWDNPYDPNGDNYFPPYIVVMKDTVVGIKSTATLHVRGEGKHKVVRYCWSFSKDTTWKDSTTDSTIERYFPKESVGKNSIWVRAIDSIGLPSKAGSFIVDVHLYPPFCSLMNDTAIPIHDSSWIHTHARDTNGSIVAYYWALDGLTFKDTTHDSLITVTFSDSGTRVILSKVCDNDTLFSPVDTLLLQVKLCRPVVTIMHDTAVAIKDSVSIRAQGIDSNGTIQKYFWAIDDTMFTDTTDGQNPVIRVSFADSSVHRIRVKVIDDDDLVSAPDSMTLLVKPYRPTVVMMPDTAVGIKDSVRIWAQGVDSNGTIRKYFWAIDDTMFTDTTDGQDPAIRVSFADSSVHRIRVKVIDDDDLVSAPDSMTLLVKPYRPVVVIMNDTSVAIYDSIVVTAEGTDSNGVVTRYLWARDGSTFSDTTPDKYIRVAFADSGVHHVGVKVIDDDSLVSLPDVMNLLVKRYPPQVTMMGDTAVVINDSVDIWARGMDSNRVIINYQWAVDGNTFTFTTINNFFKTAFKDSGTHRVKVMVTDDDGFVSAPDSMRCFAHLSPPIVTQVRDTTVSQTMSVTIQVSARDTNTGGRIDKYYWDRDNNGWDDSTAEARYTFTKSEGGLLPIRWGARDDDGNITTDTFAIMFNRKPTDVAMIMPPNNSKAVFKTFDKLTGKGTILLRFKGADPDVPPDELVYSLSAGKDEATIPVVYSGKDTLYTLDNVDSSSTYFWKLTVTDPYNGSAQNSGKFTTPYIDQMKPVITLIGPNPFYLSLLDIYTNPGATAWDNLDGNITSKIIVGGDSVNTMVANIYTVKYSVTDSSGNTDSTTRAVIVEKALTLEDFEGAPSQQTKFGAYFSQVNMDSIGCWKAWTDNFGTHYDPNPYDQNSAAPFDTVVKTGIAGNSGKAMEMYVWVQSGEHYYGFGFYLKKKNTCYNLSGLDSITFSAKYVDAAGTRIRVQFTDTLITRFAPNKLLSNVGTEIVLTAAWKKFTLRPADLRGIPGSPGEKQIWDNVKGRIRMIQFVSSEADDNDVSVNIDDIKIYGDFSGSGLLE